MNPPVRYHKLATQYLAAVLTRAKLPETPGKCEGPLRKNRTMGSQIEYVDSSQIYVTKYVRNSKAIGVLWAIFTICYAIISVMAFFTPEWMGKVQGEVPGKFGLWASCFASDTGEKCEGKLHEFYKIVNLPFLIAAVCVGVGCLCALLTVCVMVSFVFCETTKVYHVCGWLQLLSG